MKTAFFLATFCLISVLGLTQTYHSLSVFVVDKNSKRPLPGASVTVKEAGQVTVNTKDDGKAFFQSGMPVGEITYLVSKEGYVAMEGTMNITTEEKSNTIRIEMTKIPLPNEDRVLVRGEVSDRFNHDIEGAIVEATIADLIRTTKTDASGNYFIELPLSKSLFQENVIRVEVKSGSSCKKTEIIPLTRGNVITKNFELQCSGQVGRQAGKDNSSPNSGGMTTTASGIKVSVERCQLSGNKLTCYVSYENVSTNPTIVMSFMTKRNTTIDEFGNGYTASRVTIGNLEFKGPGWGKKTELIVGTPVQSIIEFDVAQPNFTRLASLQVGEIRQTFKFYNIPVSQQ